MPGVLEGGDLRGGFLAGALAEEDVVRGVGVEGRVQVNQVDALIADVLAEDVQVVAEVKAVGDIRGRSHRRGSLEWGTAGTIMVLCRSRRLVGAVPECNK